jgi:hypothetical protein
LKVELERIIAVQFVFCFEKKQSKAKTKQNKTKQILFGSPWPDGWWDRLLRYRENGYLLAASSNAGVDDEAGANANNGIVQVLPTSVVVDD